MENSFRVNISVQHNKQLLQTYFALDGHRASVNVLFQTLPICSIHSLRSFSFSIFGNLTSPIFSIFFSFLSYLIPYHSSLSLFLWRCSYRPFAFLERFIFDTVVLPSFICVMCEFFLACNFTWVQTCSFLAQSEHPVTAEERTSS